MLLRLQPHAFSVLSLRLHAVRHDFQGTLLVYSDNLVLRKNVHAQYVGMAFTQTVIKPFIIGIIKSLLAGASTPCPNTLQP